MSDKLEKTFTVKISIDKKQARERKMGQFDFDAYPNWDINYLGDEERFIGSILGDLAHYGSYTGISVDIQEENNG